jgi:AraC-like DNA-binding protein
MDAMGPLANELGVKHLSQDGFLRLLDHVLANVQPERLFSGKRTAPPASGHIEMHAFHVFDIPLTGRKHVICPHLGKETELHMRPGDALHSPPLAWKLPLWDEGHELFCLVYKKDVVRLTYVDISRPLPPDEWPVCRCFYHTQLPASEGMHGLLHALELLAEEGDPEQAGPPLLLGLARLTRAQLAADRAAVMGKAQVTFQKAQQYLVENFASPLDRQQVADALRLHPGYLSRLFREQSGMTFSHYLRKLRLEHAALLLRETDALIDEIADRCGYRSATFFVTAFRQHFGLPPGRFRAVKRSQAR